MLVNSWFVFIPFLHGCFPFLRIQIYLRKLILKREGAFGLELRTITVFFSFFYYFEQFTRFAEKFPLFPN